MTSKKNSISAILAILLLNLISINTAYAWQQLRGCLEWPTREMTLNLAALGTAQIDGVPWKTIATNSRNAWFSACEPDAAFSWYITDTACSTGTDGKNCTGFAPLGPCNGTYVLASTYFTSTGCDLGQTDVDVEINSQAIDCGWFNPTRALGVLTHEYGHVIGLDHSQFPNVLMNPDYSENITAPTQDDCTGFREIYNYPIKPINPVPGNAATGVSVSSALNWANGGGATSYDVYFGTDSTPDSTESKGNQSGLTYNPGTLAYNTTYYWRIDAKNANGTTTGDVWRFTTAAALLPLSITTPSPLSPGTVGTSYSQSLQAAGGNAPYTWSLISGSLPEGLSMNYNNGVISGIPITAGTYIFGSRVKDAANVTADKFFGLTINVRTIPEKSNALPWLQLLLE